MQFGSIMTIYAVKSLDNVKLLITFNIPRFSCGIKLGSIYCRAMSESTERRPGPIKNRAVKAVK